MVKRFYVTTPIYYVNGAPHIGTALTTAVCDFERRYRALRGEEAHFLTGTDENATKVLEAAQAAGRDPVEFTNEISQRFVDEFAKIDIAYDDFIRTTEPRHHRAVQRLFEILRENGDVYLDKYEGWYDVGSESFVREQDLVDGKSPDGNEVRWVSEENYFFKLSAYGDRLLDYIEHNPGFLRPETRKNEVVSFIKQGLRDMCITRKNEGWGIPVPGDESKVIYVWFDALINYLAATGWPDDPNYTSLWPADVHWMAKEIFTRFHATLWPAMLMAAGLPLPRTVIAHGWFTFSGEKISKSKGGLITPEDLMREIIAVSGVSEELAVDVVRFSLAALLPIEGDRDFSIELVEKRYNSDLANDLGNALNRSLSMAHKFCEGKVPSAVLETEPYKIAEGAKAAYEKLVEDFRWDVAMDETLAVIRYLNKYIDTRAPWALAKNNDPTLPSVIRSMLHLLRTVEGLIRPILPRTADQIAAQLGATPISHWDQIADEDSLIGGSALGQPVPMFPRIDPKKKMENTPAPAVAPVETPKPEAPKAEAPKVEEELLSIDDFVKIQLRVARVLEAEPVENSDKLLKLQIMIGEERRQIVAGIRKSYAVEDLVGRQIIVVYNLKPAKLRGVESQGMLLAVATDDGGSILLQPEKEAPEGGKVK